MKKGRASSANNMPAEALLSAFSEQPPPWVSKAKTVIVALLLALFVSTTCAVTVAVFSKMFASETSATRVTTALASVVTSPKLHVTVLVPVQEPWLAVALTKLRPSGSESVTTVPSAVSGPELLTVIVKVILEPIVLKELSAVLVMDKSEVFPKNLARVSWSGPVELLVPITRIFPSD